MPREQSALSADQIQQTAQSIVAVQLDSGMIPWFGGGHADAWNHIEAAMALDVAGLHSEAVTAYEWLASTQRRDGAWHQYYLDDRVEQDKLDANCVAYVAAGVWHHYLVTGDESFLSEMWPVVDDALDFILDLQTPRGEIRWARHSDGTPWSFALLTGSSSMVHSLRCGLALADHLGLARPEWELGAARLAHVVAHVPDAFAPKDRWAMDWYYPVLAGVLVGEAGRNRMHDRADDFAVDGHGIRCVSDRPWVTTAESCECAMAYLGLGDRDRAVELFGSVQRLRREDGAYLTGMVFPQQVSFPDGECSTYSAAAVILAADALEELTPASQLFIDHDALPALIEVDESAHSLD